MELRGEVREDISDIVGFLLAADASGVGEVGPRTCRRYVRNADFEGVRRLGLYFYELMRNLAVACNMRIPAALQICPSFGKRERRIVGEREFFSEMRWRWI